MSVFSGAARLAHHVSVVGDKRCGSKAGVKDVTVTMLLVDPARAVVIET
ncbi:protein of unknown function [Thauera humireducens]|nr:protein of unknown function [Thauera humireducens]